MSKVPTKNSNVLAEMEKTPYNGNSLADYFKKIDSKIVMPKKEYHDIAKNMLMQRKKINTFVNNSLIEVYLAGCKDGYIGENIKIRGKIRSGLRGEGPIYRTNLHKQDNQLELINLDEIIIQSHLPRDTVLFRGASPHDFGLSDMSSKDFIKKFYKKGKLFRIPIYPQTSLEKSVAEDFAKVGGGRILFKINAPKGTPGIYMEQLPISNYSYGNEEEILLPRDLVCKFKSHTQKDGYDEIELDIISSKPFWKKIHEFWNEL